MHFFCHRGGVRGRCDISVKCRKFVWQVRIFPLLNKPEKPKIGFGLGLTMKTRDHHHPWPNKLSLSSWDRRRWWVICQHCVLHSISFHINKIQTKQPNNWFWLLPGKVICQLSTASLGPSLRDVEWPCLMFKPWPFSNSTHVCGVSISAPPLANHY